MTTHNYTTAKTAILAAGDFPTHPAPLAALDGPATVLCRDRAAGIGVPLRVRAFFSNNREYD